VDEIFRHLRQVVVHYVRDAVYMDATGGHVGRYQHAIVAFAESLQRLVPLALAAVAVNRPGFHTLGASSWHVRVAPCLAVAKTRNELSLHLSRLQHRRASDPVDFIMMQVHRIDWFYADPIRCVMAP
jgi:hypothetical protein